MSDSTVPGSVSKDDCEASTAELRRAYVKRRFPCIADCDMCGNCKFFRGKDPEVAFADYINGIRSFEEVLRDYKIRA